MRAGRSLLFARAYVYACMYAYTRTHDCTCTYMYVYTHPHDCICHTQALRQHAPQARVAVHVQATTEEVPLTIMCPLG